MRKGLHAGSLAAVVVALGLIGSVAATPASATTYTVARGAIGNTMGGGGGATGSAMASPSAKTTAKSSKKHHHGGGGGGKKHKGHPKPMTK